MSEPQYFDSAEKAPCPCCGHLYDMAEMLNDRGIDFEGAFLMAHPGKFECIYCRTEITPEPNLEWRIWKADEYDEYRAAWGNSDKKLRAEFASLYFKPLHHPTEQSSTVANDADFARCEEILQLLEQRGYDRVKVIAEELKKRMG